MKTFTPIIVLARLAVIALAFGGLAHGQSSPADVTKLKAAAVSPDGALVAVGGSGGRVVLWDVATGRHAGSFVSEKVEVQALAFAGGGWTLAIGTKGAGVEIWEKEGSAYRRARQLKEPGLVYALAPSPDGRTLAACGHSGWTLFYDTTTWEQRGAIFERSNLTCGVAFAPDGKTLCTAGNTFSAWNVAEQSPIWVARSAVSLEDLEARTKQARRWFHWSDVDVIADAPYCADIAVAPDGRTMAGVTGVSRLDTGGLTISAWDAATGNVIWSSHSTGMTCVTFLPDGNAVASGSDDGKLRTWDARSGKMLREWSGHAQAVRALQAGREGSTFFSAGDDGRAALWDGATGKMERRFEPGN